MRKSLIRLMALLLIVMPFLGVWANESSAATSRVAVIKEMKGTVKVKKAGGSKEFSAFAKMSLNEGDVLSVGANGSAVLQFANGTSEDDRMTVSSNSKLTFSKLSNKKGTTTKVSIWSGSAWSDVKSITSAEDNFTLETPTAVMGVRGTHLFIVVDPVTGATSVMVAAGVVSTETTGTDKNKKQQQFIYPTQNALVTTNGSGQSDITTATVDLSALVDEMDSVILESFLRAAAEINEENRRLQDAYMNEMQIQQNDVQRVQGNIENLLAAVLNQALNANKIDQATLSRLVQQANEHAANIDLSRKQLDLTDAEKKQQEQQRLKGKQAKEDAEKRLQLEKEARDKQLELEQKLKDEKKKKEKENAELLKKKQKKAFDDYEAQLDQLEKDRLKEDKAKRDAEQGTVPTGTTGSGGSNSSGSPSVEPYVAPLKSVMLVYDVYSDEISASPSPMEVHIPLEESTYQLKVPDMLDDIRLEIETLDPLEDSNPLAGGDLNVVANGVPAYFDEYDGYHIPLMDELTTITIDVKPHGEPATEANTKRFTLTVIRPSLPEGISFTTSTDTEESLNWKSKWSGTFSAIASSEIDSITFNPSYGTLYDIATLSCDSMNCEGVDVNGMQASGLMAGEIYEFTLYLQNSHHSLALRFTLGNEIEQTDWAQVFEDQLNFYPDYESESVDFEHEGNVYTADVGIDVSRISLPAYFEYGDRFYVAGVWDEQKMSFESDYSSIACNEHSGFCLNLDVGINKFKVYVIDYYGFGSYTYELTVNRSDQPTGMVSWSIEHSLDGFQSVASLPLTRNAVGGECEYYNCYFAHIDNDEDNGVRLAMTLDGTKLMGYELDQGEDYVGNELPPEANQPIVIDLAHFKENSTLEPGKYEYTLLLTDRNDYTSIYRIVVFIGERQPPLQLDEIDAKDSENNTTLLDARFGGDNKWIVNSQDLATSLDIYSLNSLDTLCISPNVYGSYVECTNNFNQDYGYFTLYGLLPGVNSITMGLLDPITRQLYAEYELVIYNGIETLHPADYALQDFPYWDPAELYYEGGDVIVDPAMVPSGKAFVGVYDGRGQLVQPSGDGTYHIEASLADETYYVVVQDGQYIVSSKLSVTIPR
ncbi:FecR domain-containing protein [Cohnella yongneupensis]|uniref:FecR domain-containing protein n=1 Tax=Cohnella yongneupensis TaxID=425006 RepID=A0ABW0QYG1_9BACL